MKKIMVLLLVSITFVLSSCTTNTSVIYTGFKMPDVSTDFALNPNAQWRYEATTDVRYFQNADMVEQSDIYYFGTDSRYYQSTRDTFFNFASVKEVALLDGKYYSRVNHNNLVYQEYKIPFTKSNDSTVLDDMNLFLDHPMFRLSDGAQFGTTYKVLFSELTEKEQVYIESDLKSYFPINPIYEDGFIEIMFYGMSGSATSAQVSYTGMLGEGQYHSSHIKFVKNSTYNVAAKITDYVDISGPEGIYHESVSSMNIGDTVSFLHEFRTDIIQVEYFEVTEAGDYQFDYETDGNIGLYFIASLDGDFQYTRWENDIYSIYSYPSYKTVSLEPGIYYLYLLQMPINTHEASITINQVNTVDDSPASYTKDTPVISESGRYTFTTETLGDVDTFVVQSDCTFVQITVSDTSFKTYTSVYYTEDFNGSGLLTKSFDNMVLYLDSFEVGEHYIDVELITLYDYKPTKDDAIELVLDESSIDTFKTSFLVVPIYDGEMLYTFTLREPKNVYIFGGGIATLLDENDNEVQYTDKYMFELQPGTYYIPVAGTPLLTVAIEDPVKEVKILNDENGYDVYGFTVGYSDYDEYEITFEEEMYISFDDEDRIGVTMLFYGVDNPNMFELSTWGDYAHRVPAGTYRITFPTGERVLYDFTIIKGDPIDEPELNEVVSIIGEPDKTIYEYNLSFDYNGDEEVVVLHLPAGSTISVDLLEEFYFANVQVKYDFSTSYVQLEDINILEDPNASFTLQHDARLEFKMKSYDPYGGRIIFTGDMIFKVYVEEGAE